MSHTVVVEYVDNRMEVVESAAVANHYLCEAKLNVGLIKGDRRYEVLCKCKIAVVRAIADDGIRFLVRNRKAIRQIGLGFGRKSVLGFKLAILEQDCEPVQNAVLVRIQVKHPQAVVIKRIDISPSVMVFRDRPLLRELFALRAVETKAIVIVRLTRAKQRLHDPVLGTMIECPFHATYYTPTGVPLSTPKTIKSQPLLLATKH